MARVGVAMALVLSSAGAQRLADPSRASAGDVCGIFDAFAAPDPDTSNAAAFTTLEDTVLDVPAPGILANDECVGQVDDILQSNATGGTYALYDSGAVHYVPVANGYGEAHVDYQIDSLDYGVSNAARITMTVIPVNDAPILYQTETGCGAIILPEDSGAQSTSPCGWFALPGGMYETAQTFTPHVSTDHPDFFSAGPTLTLNSGTTPGYVTFTPKANANGFATISIWVTDSGGTANGGVNISNKHFAYVTLQPVADNPIAADDAYSTAFNQQLVVSAANGVFKNDTDIDGEGLTTFLVTGPTHGLLSLQSNGGFTYTPTTGYSGADGFTYQARNQSGIGVDDATVSLTVRAQSATPAPTVPPTARPSASVAASASPTAPAGSSPGPTSVPGASTDPSADPSAGVSPSEPVASSSETGEPAPSSESGAPSSAVPGFSAGPDGNVGSGAPGGGPVWLAVLLALVAVTVVAAIGFRRRASRGRPPAG